MAVPLRVSLLKVVSDVAREAALYEGLGFLRVDTDDPGCVGLTAGETGCIVNDRAFAAGCFGEALADRLVGQTMPYIYLDRLDETSAMCGTVVADVRTAYGTHERVLKTAEGLVILAERV